MNFVSNITDSVNGKIAHWAPKTKVEYALAHAERGHLVFPCRPGQKTPAVKKPQEWATRDAEKIRNYWRKNPDANIGLYTGDGSGALALDIDGPGHGKGNKNGDAELLRLELEGMDLPPTREAETPTKGKHLFFRVPATTSIKRGANKLAPGIDVPWYVVGGGSTTPKGRYTSTGDDIAEAPPWLVERLTKPAGHSTTAIEPAPATVDPATAKARTVRYLVEDAPTAVQDNGGDDKTMEVGRAVRDIGCSEDDAFALMLEHWNPSKAIPPWDPDGLRTKVRNVYAYSKLPLGNRAPENDFGHSPLPTDAPTGATQPYANWPWLKEMNARYAVTVHHGRTMVHERHFDHELEHERHRWITFEDFQNRFRGQRVQVPTDKGNVWVDKGKAWLDRHDKRQYDGEVFAPGRTMPPNILNLWRGFAVEPKAGNWSRFRDHLRDCVCDGDAAAFSYLLDWMARAVQEPGEQGHVAIVLQGDEGTGKGFVGREFVRLFGEHGRHLTQTRHLTGNFNAHLANTVAVFADEALFAGDPSVRGALFSLITENSLEIEAKGVDVRTSRNCLHVVMATNEEWAIPAGPHSRRFLVLRVSSKHRQDTKYFAAIQRELSDGGRAAMLHDLLARDISDFDVFGVPKTAALRDQKLMTLKSAERWLFDCLEQGQIAGTTWAKTGLSVAKDAAYADYERATQRTRRGAASKPVWAKAIKSVLRQSSKPERPRTDDGRTQAIKFLSLNECREEFEKYLGQEIDWDSDNGGHG